MKFTNAELTARMISDQKNGWPFCPRCGKPLKIDPQTQRAASSNMGRFFSSCFSGSVSPKYFCPSNHKPVSSVPLLESVIPPKGE